MITIISTKGEENEKNACIEHEGEAEAYSGTASDC